MHDLSSRCRLGHSKPTSSSIRIWSLAVVLTTIAIVASYFWLDRPIALLVDAFQGSLSSVPELQSVASIPNPLFLIAEIVLFVLGLAVCAKRPLARWQQVSLICVISIVVGEATKDLFKWTFGRPSPAIWIAQNQAPIGTREYQFHWLNGAEPFNSFPSGHMTATAALIAVLWVCYPRARPLYVAIFLLMAAVLVASNSHFLGDVIAGGLLGSTIGWIVVSVLEHRVEPAAECRHASIGQSL